ncbi:MAG: Flp pilus assembly complex ATPase component TadA [Nitrospiraceae bacterium]|nr:MAG: Flp pilus assembly complex ATPase component TadA [Nitrospiraceae bacterium]
MRVAHPTEKKKLGELLVELDLLTEEQLQAALMIHRKTAKRLGQIFVEENMISEDDLIEVLSKQLGYTHVWLRKGLVDPKIVRIIQKDKAKLYRVIPMFKVNNDLFIATADPQAVFVFDELSKLTKCNINPILSRASDILQAIDTYYDEEIMFDDFLEELNENELQLVAYSYDQAFQELGDMAEGSPIINLVNLIILKAIKDRASDIHIEPDRGIFRVRYRIDGILYEVMTPKPEVYPAVISRLKIMAKLDITERRMPQDGRIQVYLEGRTVDLRFSSLPGILSEKVVLRVLDKKNAVLDLNMLGFNKDTLVGFRNLLQKPFGLILVTGPTGSGKSTTLYSAINFLNSIEKNIVTIEDPVEYQMEIINQNEVNDSLGLTFAKILKHVLRQDPDIVMVGEIREKETAEIAIRASLTGHLVLSTLHTNDSASAISRLLDMGIPPYLISSSLAGVIAQRLIRTVCKECKTSYYPSQTLLDQLGWTEDKGIRLVKGKGCPSCYDSGYKGRAGIFEFMEVDTELKALILENPSVDEIRKFNESKYSTLKMEGYKKVKDGLTSITEISRAVYTD